MMSWVKKVLPPEKMLELFYQMSDDDLRQALRQFIPMIRRDSPSKYAVFIEEFLDDMRVK